MQVTRMQEEVRRRRSSLNSDTELNYNLGILAKHEGRSMTEEARHITKQTMKKAGLQYKKFEEDGGSA